MYVNAAQLYAEYKIYESTQTNLKGVVIELDYYIFFSYPDLHKVLHVQVVNRYCTC
jgi:hypothetical protein